MIVDNGRYIEMTEEELFDLYLKGNWDDCFSFHEFKRYYEATGCKIVSDENSPIVK